MKSDTKRRLDMAEKRISQPDETITAIQICDHTGKPYAQWDKPKRGDIKASMSFYSIMSGK